MPKPKIKYVGIEFEFDVDGTTYLVRFSEFAPDKPRVTVILLRVDNAGHEVELDRGSFSRAIVGLNYHHAERLLKMALSGEPAFVRK